jgi:ketol-acid reductoisomerase
VALAWASGIGCARAAVIDATFANETETDLFGEQAVLCGGLLALVRAAFETLVAAGYPPELAYLECCHEVKQVADLMYARGPAGMCKAISNTAEFGAYRAAELIDSPVLRELFQKMLADVQSGQFAAELRADYAKGFPWFEAEREGRSKHAMEEASRTIRGLMPWLNEA